MQVQFKTKLGDFEKRIILYPFILWLTVFFSTCRKQASVIWPFLTQTQVENVCKGLKNLTWVAKDFQL